MQRTEMNGGEALVESLRIEGVRDILGIVGSSVLEVFDLLAQTDIRYTGVRHEQVGAHMADTYGRVSGQPAVCVFQNGAGLTNAVTGVATAYRAHAPMVVISGSPVSTQLGTETYQEIDHHAIMSPITKWSGVVNQPSRIPEYVRRAFREATTPPYGPTFIDVPRDFLYEFMEYELWPRESYRGATTPTAQAADVERIATLVRNAARPVILAGGGVTWAQASDEVAHLAELLRAPVTTTYGHNDAAATSHANTLGSIGRGGSVQAMRAVEEADLILALGTRLDRFTFLPYHGFPYAPTDAKLVQIDVDPRQLGRQYPIEVGVASDVRSFTAALCEALAGFRPEHADDRAGRLAERRAAWRNEVVESVAPTGEQPPRSEEVYGVLREVLPADTRVAIDIGSTPSFAYNVLAYERPRSLFPPLGLGGVGFSLPATLGLKLADADSPVVGLMGDGAFTMALPALFTAVEHNLDVTAVVLDNQAWGAEKANQLHFYDRNFFGTNLDNPDLAGVAQAMGAHALHIDELDAVEKAVQSALDHHGPSVVQINVNPDQFPLPARRDALKKPRRGLYA